MVAVCSPSYDSNSPPLAVRLRNAQGSGFEVRVDRADGSTAPIAPVAVQCAVLEEGVYSAAEHGIQMEVVKFNSTVTDGKSRWAAKSRTYANSYTNPVVVGQVMSYNDPAFSIFWAHGSKARNPPSATALRVGKHVGEDPNYHRADELIGYIVLEAGIGSIDGIEYMAALGGDQIWGIEGSPPSTYNIAGLTNPLAAVAASAGMDGNNGGWPVLYGSSPISANSLSLAIDEDQIRDWERVHTTEQVAHIVFGSPSAPPPPVGVSVTPGSVSLGQSENQQFTASVSNSSNQSVTWSISPSVGQISSSGTYTAPASITSQQAVTVTARSVVDATKSATAVVTLQPPVDVSVTPGSVSLGQSENQQFTASVSNSSNQSVTWSISPSVGQISSSGTYTAPVSITSQQAVTVTARSVVDTTKTASATVSLIPPVAVTISPAVTTLRASESEIFAATVGGDPNPSVEWSLEPAVGSLSESGLTAAYTSPSTINSDQTVLVTARSVLDSTKIAQATVSLLRTVTVSVSPSNVFLRPSESQQFSATVGGASNTAVTWQVNPSVGTLSPSGLYAAPASVSTEQTVVVMATSVEDESKSATVIVTLRPPVLVSVSPGSVNLHPNTSQQFTATVTGAATPAVSWQVNPPMGVMSADGLFTAPESVVAAQNVVVTATSIEDPTKSASAVATLRPLSTDNLSLNLGPAAGAVGSRVSLPVSLSVLGGEAPAAIQWTIGFSSAEFANISVEPGPTAAAAGKDVTCLMNATSATCIVAGMNQTQIPPGVVANVSATISTSSSSTSRVIQVSDTVAAAPSGGSLPIAGHEGIASVTDQD